MSFVFIRRLGCEPNEVFSFEALEKQLKKNGVFAVPMAAMLLPMLTSDVGAPDLDEISSSDKIEIYSDPLKNPVFIERMREVINDVVRLGYL